MQTIAFAVSSIFGIWAYAVYFRKILKHSENGGEGSESFKPNRWSWLIWSVATAVESFTYEELSGDPFKSALFFISAGCCVVITTLIWTKSVWAMPDWTEILCTVASIAAIIVYVVFKEAFWAHFIAIAALPIAFIPTYRDAWLDWKSENTPSWMLWTIGDIATLSFVVMRLDKGEELPYAIIEMLCHGLVWGIVAFKRRKMSTVCHS